MSFIKKPSQRTLSVIGIIILALALLKVIVPRTDIRKQIDDLRTEAAPMFDSLNNQKAAEKSFFDSLNHLISSGRLDGAEYIVDQLLAKDSINNFYRTLKGQIYDARGKYDSAIIEYTKALWPSPYPNTLDKRAITFIKLRRYNDAIQDYRNAYEQNSDYSYKLACSFELDSQKDSAIKYYNIYLQDYPDSLYRQLEQRGIYVYPPDSAKLKIGNLKKM